MAGTQVTGSTGAYIAAMNNPLPTGVQDDSPFGMMQRGGSNVATKMFTLQNNGPFTAQLFQLNGTCQIDAVWMIIQNVVNNTTVTGCQFKVDDAANPVPMNSAADLSGVPPGSLIIKNDVSANALAVMPSNQCRGLDTKFQPFIAAQKGGQPTSIAFSFTGDANTNVQAAFFVKWTALMPGSEIKPTA